MLKPFDRKPWHCNCLIALPLPLFFVRFLFDAATTVRVSLDLVEIHVKVRLAVRGALYNPCSFLIAAHAGRRGLCVRRDRRGGWRIDRGACCITGAGQNVLFVFLHHQTDDAESP